MTISCTRKCFLALIIKFYVQNTLMWKSYFSPDSRAMIQLFFYDADISVIFLNTTFIFIKNVYLLARSIYDKRETEKVFWHLIHKKMIFHFVQCQCIIHHPVVMTKLALNPQQIKPLNFSVFTLFDTDPGHWAKILK